ncbi:MAG: hypothetical protein AB1898_30860 [Acidobacteriota bacterium]
MTIPNPHPKIFVPGKIIQVRSVSDPLILTKLVLVSVEEHVRHVVEMLEWLFPDTTEVQHAGAVLHDVHKKVGTRYEFFHACGRKPAPSEEDLLLDFYGNGQVSMSLSARDASRGFLELARDPRRRRLWPFRRDDGSVSEVRVDLDPPFGNHAAEATEEDLLPYRDGSVVLAEAPAQRDYVLNLVRLHHSFRPNRIIGACAQHGDGIARDLYRLIVADHAGSRWAEYVVQQLEGGLEKPESVDFFDDVEINVAVEATARGSDHDLQVGVVRLQRSKLPGETGDAREAELFVRYYALAVDWDLRQLADEAETSATDRQQRASRRPRTRRARS